MAIRKAELAAGVVLVAVLAAGALVVEGHRHLTSLSSSAAWRGLLIDSYGQWLYVATLASLGVAFLVSVFFMLPLVRAQTREQGKLHTLTDVLQRRSKEMERAALTDVLTGLRNRRYFDEALTQFLDEFGRIGRPVGLLVLDLDHFKAINDTYGHDVGDEVLRAVSRCLMEFTRYHDVVARLGGEEFGVVVPNINGPDLVLFADRLRQAVERLSLDVGNVRLRITISVGLAVAKPDEDAAALYKRADVNLYGAKQAGRNRVCA